MASFTTTNLSDDFTVHIQEKPSLAILPSEVLAQIESIWNEEQQKRGQFLFNGKILNHISHDSHHLVGHFVEYKHYLAQLRDPTLRPFLPIQGVGMTGVTFAENHVLMGRRASHVTSYPNKLEFAPAGGVDADYVENDLFLLNKALLSELHEEVGYNTNAVESLQPFALISEPHINHWEICTRIILKPHQKDLLTPTSPEYSEIFWLPINTLNSFFDQHANDIIPMSRFIERVIS